MKTTIDWTRIVSQDRAKAIGIPWSKEEEKAIKDGISPDDVRAGILNTKDKEDADKSGKVKLERLSQKEVIDIAKEAGIEFDETVVIKSEIIAEIKKVNERNEDLLAMTRPELSKIAKELEIEFVYIKTTKTDFIELIKKARNQ